MRIGGSQTYEWRYGGGGVGLLCLLLVVADLAASAYASPMSPPSSPYDYDSARDLYEALLRREVDGYGFGRVRKANNRSPSLRLRFGKRPDPALSLYQLERGLLQSDDN